MTRNEFLKQKWNRYPLLPKGVSFFGRIQNIQRFEHREWTLTLAREGKTRTRNYPKLFLPELPDFEADHLLQVGDLVAISDNGVVTLLAPQQEKLPDLSLRMEQLRLWDEYLHWVREFFRERKFVEIQTPSLVKCPGTEPSLDAFSTELVIGSHREKLFLPTSPELHLKKALALGAEKIFEIRRCFRNGEVTDQHQPEFTMIEWYRAYEDLEAIKRDVTDLVAYLGIKIPALKGPTGVGSQTVAELFAHHCGYKLKPETSLSELKALAQTLGVDARSATQIDDYFFLIFMEKIESQLPLEQLCFVENYPPYQAALARLSEDGWGERFEVYWRGLEIANAFHELNDPQAQQQRFADDLGKKRILKKEEIPLDDEFMRCLEAGMPPSGGIALGLERLFMALTNTSKITETRLFPTKV